MASAFANAVIRLRTRAELAEEREAFIAAVGALGQADRKSLVRLVIRIAQVEANQGEEAACAVLDRLKRRMSAGAPLSAVLTEAWTD